VWFEEEVEHDKEQETATMVTQSLKLRLSGVMANLICVMEKILQYGAVEVHRSVRSMCGC